MSSNIYDTIIIGGGPGGISAAIYAIRAGLKVLLVEKLGIGGQIARSHLIENYPGFPSISGRDLMAHFEKHASSLNLEIKYAEVKSIVKEGRIIKLETISGELEAYSVIIATGAEPRPLGFEGEKEFFGRGVGYCATCDGPFYRGKNIAVVGGGDTAVKDAVYLSSIASKILMVHRRDQFRAEKLLQDKLFAAKNVEFKLNSIVKKVTGDDAGVTEVVIANKASNKEENLKVDGLFVFVGTIPITDFVDCKKDQSGFIEVDFNMMSSVDGIFAIGDCRVTPLRQVATAVGDGAIAAVQAYEYVKNKL